MSAPVDPVRLLRTSPAAALATVERLLEQGIEAEVGDVPNRIVQLLSGGNYQVSVLVPAGARQAAQAELERWRAESAPRVEALARDVQRGLLLAALPGTALALALVVTGSTSHRAWLGVLGLLLAGVAAWTVVSRRSARRDAEPVARQRDASG